MTEAARRWPAALLALLCVLVPAAPAAAELPRPVAEVEPSSPAPADGEVTSAWTGDADPAPSTRAQLRLAHPPAPLTPAHAPASDATPPRETVAAPPLVDRRTAPVRAPPFAGDL